MSYLASLAGLTWIAVQRSSVRRRAKAAALGLCIALSVSVCPAGGEQVAPFETTAAQAYLVDAETGTVLLAKNEDVPVPPASMAKLMTARVVFEALAKGTLTAGTEFPVSEHAWRTGGAPSGTSTMFAALNSRVAVSDLLQGLTVQLANDACIILAEGLSGSEEAFAARMTEEGRRIGLTASVYRNATGLPQPENTTTMRDLVRLSRYIQSTYPQQFALYAQPEFSWNKIKQRNRNPLVFAVSGVDGFVTGFAEGYGFSITATMERDGRRVFLALGGLATDKERAEETRRVLEWSMTAFVSKRLFTANETIGEASVYGGAQTSVPLVTKDPVDVLVPSDNAGRLNARVVYRWPLPMPVRAGDPAGTLTISMGDRVLREVPLFAGNAVETGSLVRRSTDALQELLFFWL